MKKLLNTLYITSEDGYLSLEGENVVVISGDEIKGRVPLHNLDGIVSCGFRGASPALMNKCTKDNISLCFLSGTGRFLAGVTGEQKGNVLLRKEQYRISDNEERSIKYARNFILGKLYNSKYIIERAARDYSMRLDSARLKVISLELSDSMNDVKMCMSHDELRGIEGKSAARYFSVFDEMILQQKNDFRFEGRNKRPPMDNVNAMLSFAYTLLALMCASALEAAGLDSYVGFMHTDRPGRRSLALDMMEELRSVFADRFVLSLINKRLVSGKGFKKAENGAVLMDDDTRKVFFTEWQKRKTEVITHPFLKEKVEWGVVPYTQALLLARTIRGDLDEYPPFLWK